MNNNTCKYVHVAGTNGKGSTCAYIAHGLMQAGYSVGKFTSPHVLNATERITVNGAPIDTQCLERLCRAVNAPDGTPLFNVYWQAALLYFAMQNVEYAVIETGIGGLLDCTNKLALPDYVCPLFETASRGHDESVGFKHNKLALPDYVPVASVITKIGYDHTELLGETIEEIAAHKAGIIKASVPVVTDPTQFDGAMRVIRETALSRGSRLVIPAKQSDNPFKCNEIVARETLKVLGVDDCDFSHVELFGRMQTISEKPLIIVDGAHNPDAVRAIAKIAAKMPHKNKVVVFGTQKSKDREGCIRELAVIGYTHLISVDDVSCAKQAARAVKSARALVSEDDMILVCGSFYLVGNVIVNLL